MKSLHPAYFAMVMATGIVSLAAHLVGPRWLAVSLLALNVVFAAVLAALTVARVVRHRDEVMADLLHHGRSVGFFTTVAATAVLGSQVLAISQAWRAAAALWFLGQTIYAQASVLAYRDAFLITAVVFAAALLPTWLLDRAARRAGPP